MKVDEMEAGRELDKLIAVEVMGWTRTEDLSEDRVIAYIQQLWGSDRIPGKEEIHHQRMRWIIGGECDHARWMRPDGAAVGRVPDYSVTDGAACWVLDQMYTDGWTVDVGSLALVPRGWRSHMVNMFCDDFYTHPRYVEANADTRALAICQCALKAKGMEEVQRENQEKDPGDARRSF